MPATRQSQRGCRSQKPHWALLLALSLSSHDRPAPASLGGRFSSLGSPLAAAVAAALPAHALDPAELPTVLEPLPPPAWSPTLCGSGVNPWDYGGGDLEEADEEPCWALDALPLELPPPPPAWAAAEPAEVTAALEAARASQGAVAEGTAEGPGAEGAAELRRQGSAAAAAAAATQAAFSQQSSAAGTAVMAAGGLSTPGGGDQGGDRVARLLQAMARVAYAQHPHPYKPTQRVLAAPPRPRGPLGPATGGRRSEGAAEEAIPASDFGVEERAAASGGPMERMAAAGDGEAFAALARLEALVAAFEADNLRAAQAQADVAVMAELEAGALRPAGGTPPAAAATPAAEVAEAMPAAATAASAADAGSRPEPANPAHVPPAFWPVLTRSSPEPSRTPAMPWPYQARGMGEGTAGGRRDGVGEAAAVWRRSLAATAADSAWRRRDDTATGRGPSPAVDEPPPVRGVVLRPAPAAPCADDAGAFSAFVPWDDASARAGAAAGWGDEEATPVWDAAASRVEGAGGGPEVDPSGADGDDGEGTAAALGPELRRLRRQLLQIAPLPTAGRRGVQILPSSIIVPVTDFGFNCSSLSGLEACAEPQCADFFDIVRAPNGTVSCQQTSPIPPPGAGAGAGAAVLVVPYDYDLLFQFGDNSVLNGLSLGAQALNNAKFATQINQFPALSREDTNTMRVATAQGSLLGYEGVLQGQTTRGTTGGFDPARPATFSFGLNLRTRTDTLISRLALPGFSASERDLGTDVRPNVALGLTSVVLGG